jgi:hypothetical protein
VIPSRPSKFKMGHDRGVSLHKQLLDGEHQPRIQMNAHCRNSRAASTLDQRKLRKHNVLGSRFHFRQVNAETSGNGLRASKVRSHGQAKFPPCLETPLQNPYV